MLNACVRLLDSLREASVLALENGKHLRRGIEEWFFFVYDEERNEIDKSEFSGAEI